MKQAIKIILAIALLLGGAVLFYKNVYLPKSTYESYYPEKGVTSVTVFGIGELSAEKIYLVGTPTGGKILSVHTDQGRWIKRGDLIAKIDPVDLETRLLSAKASLKRAGLDLEASKKEYMIAKDQAALSLSNYNKDRQVYKAKGISKFAYEKSETEMLTAKAQAELSKAKIESQKIRTEEVTEEIRGVQKRVDQMTILSPVDGYVIEKSIESGQSVPPASTLVQIVDAKTLWIKTWIDERISGKVKVGQKASITLRSRETTPYKGVVKRIAAVSDSVTQEREVDVGFEKIPVPFYINEQAEVSIIVETFKGLYKIPLHFLRTYKGQKGVWVNESGKAHFLKLSIIAEDSEFAGVEEGAMERTEILIPDEKKKPLSEGSRITP